MADPFVSEIRLFSFNWAPVDWALCNGELLPITQHAALYSLLGNAFGGDGRSTFALPDLRGRVAYGQGTYSSPYEPSGTTTLYDRGQFGGATQVTLYESQMAAHTHQVVAEPVNADTKNFTLGTFALATDGQSGPGVDIYAANQPTSTQNLNPGSVSSVGGGQAHYNLQPYQVVSFCISLTGTYPSRN